MDFYPQIFKLGNPTELAVQLQGDGSRVKRE